MKLGKFPLVLVFLLVLLLCNMFLLESGAAPINPSELGRNKRYVFALPPRYNFAFPTGYEEVEEILEGKPLEPTKDFKSSN